MSKNVRTRQDTTEVLVVDKDAYKFSPVSSFPGPPYKLPTQKVVVQRVLAEKMQRKRAAALTWALELRNIWIFCKVYPL